MSIDFWQHIVNKLDPHGRFIRAWELEGGSSATMTAVTFKTEHGRLKTIVIRQVNPAKQQAQPQIIQREYQILSAIHKAGITAPEPILFANPPQHERAPYLIMSYIKGAPTYERTFTQQMAIQIAQQLRLIHQTKHSNGTDWSDTLSDWGTSADKALWSEPPERYERFHESHIRHILKEQRPWNVNQERLCLLHGDYWPGNWLWQSQTLIGIVDWEDAQLGHPLADVAIARFDLLFIFGHEIMQAFTAAYLRNSPFTLADIAIWDLYAALRAMHGIEDWARGWPDLGRPDITLESMQECLHFFIQETGLIAPKATGET